MARPSHKLWLRLLAFAACGLGGCVGPGLEPPSPQPSLASTPVTPGQAKQGIDAGAANTAGPPSPTTGAMPAAPAPTPAPIAGTPATPAAPAAMTPAPGGDAVNGPTVADDDDDAGTPDAAVPPDAAVTPDAAAITPAP